jgi:hypothetical protein
MGASHESAEPPTDSVVAGDVQASTQPVIEHGPSTERQNTGVVDEREGLGGSTPKPMDAQPHIRRLLSEGRLRIPIWVWPGVVVVVTGVIGHGPDGGHDEAAATWIAFVCAWVTGVLVGVALEPAPYARRLAVASATGVGMAALALLLWQIGRPLP